MEYLIIILLFLVAAGFLIKRTIRVFKREGCYSCSHDCSSCEIARQDMAKEIFLKKKKKMRIDCLWMVFLYAKC